MPENTAPESFDLRSHSLPDDKRRELLRLFPEIATEGGKIDFDRLKLALGEAVDAGRERYGMNWPGKADCFRTIQAPSVATLRPAPEESVNFDTTENLIIEGDNLEVLKLLQKSYLGKVKLIYIDPPYNTGNDFIYPDNYAESLQTYLEYTGQVDAQGRKFGSNPETDGRFHSRWLNMMYPRLYLARNLLAADGVIVISIDDSEQHNLRRVADEVFGEDNFVAQVVWEKGRKNDAKLVSVGHEYLLIYSRDRAWLNDQRVMWREAKPGAVEVQTAYLEFRQRYGGDDSAVQRELRAWYLQLPLGHPAKKLSRYGNVDRNGVWRDDNMSWPGGGGPTYDVPHPVTGQPCAVPEGGWRYSTYTRMQEVIASGKVVFRADHREPPIRKTYLVRSVDDEEEADSEGDVGIQVAGSYFYRSGLQASRVLAELFGERVFDNPKDHEVLARWISYSGRREHNDIILDFFAGSGSTAHAVLELNERDGGDRRFVLVQLPEPTERNDYPTIADITKDRVRRVIKRLNEESGGKLNLEGGKKQDRGFRVFKLAESNFMPWDAEAPKDQAALAEQLEMHVRHIRQGRTDQDILFEILLKDGFPPTTQIAQMELAGRKVYSVAAGSFLISLERELTLELIRALAEQKPERVVLLDEGFAGNDQLKANAVKLFENRGVTRFRTV